MIRELDPRDQRDALLRQRISHEARVHVFSAVVREDDTRHALDFYKDHIEDLVPDSVDRWAKRTQKNVEEARTEEAIKLFERDKKIADKYSQGVKQEKEIIYLGDLIAEEKGKMREITKKVDALPYI